MKYFRLTGMFLGCILGTVACVSTHVDHAAQFHVIAVVTDPDGQGISGIEVLFRDIDLDEWASRNGDGILIGNTNHMGRMDDTIVYTWGYDIRAEPAEVFVIELRNDDRLLVQKEYRVSDLTSMGDEYVIRIEEVIP